MNGQQRRDAAQIERDRAYLRRLGEYEDLILLKLIANRSHDQVDAMNLARLDGIDWAYIAAEASTWAVGHRLQRLREIAGV